MSVKKTLIILGVTLIIAGCTSYVYHFYQLFKSDPSSVIFKVPGSTEFEVEKPGNYTLWHNYKTLHEGVVYNSPRELPAGTTISIINSSGQLVSLEPDLGSHASSGNSSKGSIGEVQINGPTTLTIEVTGDLNPSIFSFSESRFLKNFLAIMLSTIGLIFPGGGILFWGCILKNKQSPPPLPTN